MHFSRSVNYKETMMAYHEYRNSSLDVSNIEKVLQNIEKTIAQENEELKTLLKKLGELEEAEMRFTPGYEEVNRERLEILGEYPEYVTTYMDMRISYSRLEEISVRIRYEKNDPAVNTYYEETKCLCILVFPPEGITVKNDDNKYYNTATAWLKYIKENPKEGYRPTYIVENIYRNITEYEMLKNSDEARKLQREYDLSRASKSLMERNIDKNNSKDAWQLVVFAKTRDAEEYKKNLSIKKKQNELYESYPDYRELKKKIEQLEEALELLHKDFKSKSDTPMAKEYRKIIKEAAEIEKNLPETDVIRMAPILM